MWFLQAAEDSDPFFLCALLHGRAVVAQLWSGQKSLERQIGSWTACTEPAKISVRLQLVPAVTELVISELLWLNFSSPEKPVYVYLHSIGSQTPDGQAVGFDTEAYAILDTLAYIRPEIHTLALGQVRLPALSPVRIEMSTQSRFVLVTQGTEPERRAISCHTSIGCNSVTRSFRLSPRPPDWQNFL